MYLKDGEKCIRLDHLTCKYIYISGAGACICISTVDLD